MRFRSVLLVLGLVLLAGFVLLNVGEFTRPSDLNLGFVSLQAPLGLVMLIVLVGAVLLFMAASAYAESAYLHENRQATRALQAQRELADQAEASRFTELRHFLMEESRAAHAREVRANDSLDERLDQLHHALKVSIEDTGNSLAAYIGELEDRLERPRVASDLADYDRQ